MTVGDRIRALMADQGVHVEHLDDHELGVRLTSMPTHVSEAGVNAVAAWMRYGCLDEVAAAIRAADRRNQPPPPEGGSVVERVWASLPGTAREVAAATGVPEAQTARILSRLAVAGRATADGPRGNGVTGSLRVYSRADDRIPA